MARMGDMFPSKWLSAADLHDNDATLTISSISQELVGQGEEAERKWVVYFNEVNKGLVLNKTNATSFANCFGDDTDEWEGRRVVLYPTEVNFSGRMVEAIRVKEKATKNANKPVALKPGKPQPAKPMTQEEVDAGEDSDIPF